MFNLKVHANYFNNYFVVLLILNEAWPYCTLSIYNQQQTKFPIFDCPLNLLPIIDRMIPNGEVIFHLAEEITLAKNFHVHRFRGTLTFCFHFNRILPFRITIKGLRLHGTTGSRVYL